MRACVCVCACACVCLCARVCLCVCVCVASVRLGAVHTYTQDMAFFVCVALLKKMLRITPSKRYSVKDIKEHIWYKK